MLVKYYLSDSIKAPFEDFDLGLRNPWAGLGAYSNSLGKGDHIVNSNQKEKLNVNFEHDKRQYRKIHSAEYFL